MKYMNCFGSKHRRICEINVEQKSNLAKGPENPQTYFLSGSNYVCNELLKLNVQPISMKADTSLKKLPSEEGK